MFHRVVRVAAMLLVVVAPVVVAPAWVTNADAEPNKEPKKVQGRAAPAARAAPAVRSAPAARHVAPAARHVAPAARTVAPAARTVAPRVHSAPRIAKQPTPTRQITRSQGGPSRTVTRIHKGGDTNRAASIRNNRGQAAREATQARREATKASRNLARQQKQNTPNVAARNRGDRNPTNQNTNQNLVTRSANPPAAKLPALAGERGARNRSLVLRNKSFADRAARDPAARALARATFRGHFADQGARFDRSGRFADHGWRSRHRGFVIGWAGPLFWPYAYDDFVDYTYWPHAYDNFWPYAYDDVYVSIFGSYAYAGDDYANVPSSPSSGRARRSTTSQPAENTVAQICAERASGLTQWPIERITQAVEPDETQRAALEELKNAATKAVALMQSACPSDLPSTPTGRLAAMRTRIETMLQAVAVVRPTLEWFYQSLNDEQKARFNTLDAGEQPAAGEARTGNRPQTDLTRVCSGQATASDLPLERIEQALRPNDAQRAALQELNDASRKAADLLQANCTDDQSLTPPGRLEAMERRLNAMLTALNTVQPALERFYGSLNDEQKARFNELGPRQTARQN